MPSKERRLLLVTQHFWPEVFRINDIVQGFLADGIAVDVLCGLPNYPQGRWFDGYSGKGPLREDWQGARLFRCKEIPRTGNSGLRIFLNYVSWPLYAAGALRRLPDPAQHPYDVVLCYNTSPVLMCWPAVLAARRYRVPMVNYVLDIWPENLYSVLPVKNRLLRRVAQRTSDALYRRADRLVTLSEGLQARLQARVGGQNPRGCVERQKTYAVLPQYCEDLYAQPACDDDLARQNAGRFTLLFAGNLSPAQSLETALQAMALLRDAGLTVGQTPPPATAQESAPAAVAPPVASVAGPTPAPTAAPGTKLAAECPTAPIVSSAAERKRGALPIQLLVVGDGMSRAALQQMTARLGLEDCVRFYGSVPPQRIPALAGACDALLVSLSDSPDLGLTVPAKLASCMAMRKPLVVSMDGAGADAARQSGGALVTAACDAAALADSLCRLAAMPADARTALGAAAFAYYQSHYSRSVLLRQLEELLF